MQIIRTRISVKPEEKGAFVAYLRQKASEIKQNFAGCDQFELLADTGAEANFMLYEEWQSQEAFGALRQSDFFKQIGEKVFPMLTSKLDAVYFSAERVDV